MHELNIREMRESLGQLDQLINEVGELVVTRHGKAIARILPVQGHKIRPTHADLRSRTARLKVDSASLIRADRDGR